MSGWIPSGSGGGGAETLVELTDTPSGYGSAGQVLQSNGVSSVAWATAGGSYAPNPMDWAASAEGVGTSTALLDATYPDLSDQPSDSGQALASGPTEVAGGLRIEANVNNTSFAGILLGTGASSTDAGGAVRIAPYQNGGAFNSSIYTSWGLYLFKGDSGTGDFISVGFGRNNDSANTALLWRRANTTGGRQGANKAFGVTTITDYAAPRLGSKVDLGFERDATTGDVSFFIGTEGVWQHLFTESGWSTGAIVAAHCVHSGTAGVTVGADIHNIANPASYTALPRIMP